MKDTGEEMLARWGSDFAAVACSDDSAVGLIVAFWPIGWGMTCVNGVECGTDDLGRKSWRSLDARSVGCNLRKSYNVE